MSLRCGGTLHVADVMVLPPPAVPAHLPVGAARKIAALRGADLLLVELDGHLLGVLDLTQLDSERDGDPVARHVCSLSRALSPNVAAQRARDWLVDHHLSSAPVAVGLFLVGSISRARLDRALADRLDAPLARVAA